MAAPLSREGRSVPIHYPDILTESSPPRRFRYTDKDAILYALGIGFGSDPLDERELSFVYEKDLKVVPTAAAVLIWAQIGARVDELLPAEGRRKSVLHLPTTLHGEQRVELHRPLPPQGEFTVSETIDAVYDKGPGKGALVVRTSRWTDEAGALVATSSCTMFARSDGGFGGPAEGMPLPHPIPPRAPDRTVILPTRPDQALLYRLNGDRNPLHADPHAARAGGFPRPILHGLCTYGMTCRAVLQTFADYDPARIASHQARFTAPVFPGETLAVDLWQDGPKISFTARVVERDVMAIRNGLAVLRG